MLDRLFEYILAEKDKPRGWQEFLPMLVIFGIIIMRGLAGKFKFGKDEDAGEQRPAEQQPPSAPESGPRYAPMDEQGRVIQRPQTERQRRTPPAQRPIRRPDSVHAAPIAPAQAKLMPEHDHTLELAARKKYQQEQLAQKKKRAAQQRLIAQQIRQKAAKAQEQAPKHEPEILEAVEPVTLENFISQPQNLRTAFVLSEVLGKPIAMRGHSSTRIY
jgi:hypothetical protein